MQEKTPLPLPYPDELLYSVITRYHLRSNNMSPKWTLREIYGTDNVIPTIDLPSHLDALKSNSMFESTTDYWIENHTLYPYYAVFLPEERTQRLREFMKSQNGSGIHAFVGITASTVARSSDLCFCPSCYEEDIKQFGEPYWHRIHQVPGVWVCPEHTVVLQKIADPVSDRHGLTILPIARSMFQSVSIMKDVHNNTADRLAEIAHDISILLNAKFEFSKVRNNITFRLSEKSYITASGRVRQRKLEEQFNLYYDSSLLDLLDSQTNQSEYSWLSLAARSNTRRAIHPLRQLLLIRFLFGDFRSFLEQPDIDYTPFGIGPWPCLNKAAKHYKQLIINDCQISRCTDTGKPIGTFACECGFSYSRRGPDRSENDKFRRGRIKSYGHVWANKLELCLQIGLSYRTTAQWLGVDTNTVIKYANGEELDHVKSSSEERKPITLKNASKANKIGYTRVNWEKRDLELSWKVEELCKAILSDRKTKPVRISVAVIGKRLGKLSWLQKNKDKLLVTMGIMQPYLESVSQFQIRRLQWAADQMQGEWPIKRWKLIKKAGLRPGSSKEVQAEIDRCVGLSANIHYSTLSEVASTWVH